MKIKIILLSFFITAFCHAQTKVIAHKSHSGSNRSFSKAYQQGSSDLNRSNFGLPGNKNIFVLDTVVAVNDSVTILKMRESSVCFPYKTAYTELKDSDFKSKTVRLVNDPVFTRKNTVTFIKSAKYYEVDFSNPMNAVVFIGFKK